MTTQQTNWLLAFRNLFSEATTEHYERAARMDELENAVSEAASTRQVTSQVLRTIETDAAWVYDDGWPRFSETLAEPVVLPSTIDGPVKALFARLKHIEVVSVVLRFMYPERFGILSPPVASLLCFPPLKDNISYYREYLGILRTMRRDYGLARVADADMGLWSAAELSSGSNHDAYRALTDQMENDPYFQMTRFNNLMQHLPIAEGQERRLWLRLLAESLVRDRDALAVVAGLLLARSFEELVFETAATRGIDLSGGAWDQQRLKDYVYQLERSEGRSKRRGLWNECRDLRNRAVHGEETPSVDLSKADVRRFLSGVKTLEPRAGPKT